ncbi:putative bud site selection protein 20 [Monocercomonoides exilis]|uniref:putative bud site selection protein 20 n=1 Tax=Monocercomonoides exilis TaxID=2049356 RepID=UPI0035593EAA|nr:putative bud site selection protein 20 [Monocercomonoides exilis]|eukprot:MONOS_5471.1-p1 / transcript=MONOS_5471.1 / gene=MONOS_5471 / organism=Monocercomonoides_exilis_PA203 / gene_product=unspecified product / transcript_product=unspecified product / location=Mono_scaffold00159:89853-90442(+) / protein_length=131 / sequence_SO=supercontig / SO=protein_coding / is_pseudo=false
MGRNARSRKHCKTSGHKTAKRAIYFSRDLDLVHSDVEKGKAPPKINPDDDRQFLCITCSRYFIDERSLLDHKRTKQHKRRLKALKEKPYTSDDAILGAGKGLPRAGYDDGPAHPTEPKEDISEGKMDIQED